MRPLNCGPATSEYLPALTSKLAQSLHRTLTTDHENRKLGGQPNQAKKPNREGDRAKRDSYWRSEEGAFVDEIEGFHRLLPSSLSNESPLDLPESTPKHELRRPWTDPTSETPIERLSSGVPFAEPTALRCEVVHAQAARHHEGRGRPKSRPRPHEQPA